MVLAAATGCDGSLITLTRSSARALAKFLMQLAFKSLGHNPTEWQAMLEHLKAALSKSLGKSTHDKPRVARVALGRALLLELPELRDPADPTQILQEQYNAEVHFLSNGETDLEPDLQCPYSDVDEDEDEEEDGYPFVPQFAEAMQQGQHAGTICRTSMILPHLGQAIWVYASQAAIPSLAVTLLNAISLAGTFCPSSGLDCTGNDQREAVTQVRPLVFSPRIGCYYSLQMMCQNFSIVCRLDGQTSLTLACGVGVPMCG